LLILDTDHYSEWERGSAAGRRLLERLQPRRAELAVTVITVEEQMRGWLGESNRQRELSKQVLPYAKLQRQVEIFGEWLILP
jgi:tRNA(fMet)-specific endonuclease VapC